MISIDVPATQNLRARKLESELIEGNVAAVVKAKNGEYCFGKFNSLNLDANGDYVIEISID